MVDCLTFRFLDAPVHDGKRERATQRDIILKTASVAIAAFVFMAVQMRSSIGKACAIAGTLSTLTWLSEHYLRQDPSYPRSVSNWFHTQHVHSEDLIKFFCFTLCANLIAGIVLSLLNISIGQHVQELIKKRELRILIIACIVAPVCEEILFRGFLKERIEDACTLFSKSVRPLSDDSVMQVSRLGQSLIFGYVHMNSMQTRKANAIIFLATALFGYGWGEIKEHASTLVIPICFHSAVNTSVTVRLLLLGH